MALPAQVLRKRAGGMGVFFTCYYVAMALARRRRARARSFGTAAAPALFAAAMVLLCALALMLFHAAKRIKNNKRNAVQETGSFDYIVVGAGSAGCVLANRLTASGRHRVLLIEAGGEDRNLWIHVPIGYAKLFTDARHNWLYNSEPEPELSGRQIIQPRGKVMGGSSSINGLLYIRGQAEDFDHWRQLGNAGWSFADVLPYFRRAEDQQRGEDELHGVGGPLVGVATSAKAIRCATPSSMRANRPACRAPRISTGRRRKAPAISSSPRARAGAGRPRAAISSPRASGGNLAVVSNALTTRILFEGRRAVGVEYRKDGATHTARANGEVILSGGAFNSPQLLQLSGVGPAELLQQHGIKVIADMKGVGADLQDHYQARFNYRCTERNHHQRHDGQPGRPGRGRPALRAVPQGLPHHRRRLCGRLLQDRSVAADARRAVPFHPVLGRRGRAEAASLAGLPRLDLPASSGKPRLRCASSRPTRRRRPRSSRAT